jgi:DMSO/TMAO reductase YedYZ molybdopterin-dependent catalytic subunit
MPPLSRRRLLQTAAAIGLSVLPVPALGALLDRLFGQREPKLTSPITPNDEFYLTSYQSPPTIRVNDWSLSVSGSVERPMTLTYDELLAKPAVSQVVTLECVGNTVAGEFISTAEWTGIPLRSLLEEANVREPVFDVVFHAADGYTDSIPYERAIAGDVMIAHSMNGARLPQGHGFPARAIVPGHYGMKSVQWMTKIEAVAHDHKGYYQRKGGPKRRSSRRCRVSICPGTVRRFAARSRRSKESPLRGREESGKSKSVPMGEGSGALPSLRRPLLPRLGDSGAMTGSWLLRVDIRCSFVQRMEPAHSRLASSRILRLMVPLASMKSPLPWPLDERALFSLLDHSSSFRLEAHYAT